MTMYVQMYYFIFLFPPVHNKSLVLSNGHLNHKHLFSLKKKLYSHKQMKPGSEEKGV